MEVKEEA